MGLRPAKNLCACFSLMMQTFGLVAVSASLNSLPAMSGMPMVEK
jgi:hypothetical protein